jgi:hypothetical protein
MKSNFRFLFLFYLKAENFIMLDRNELWEETNITSKTTSEAYKLREEMIP